MYILISALNETHDSRYDTSKVQTHISLTRFLVPTTYHSSKPNDPLVLFQLVILNFMREIKRIWVPQPNKVFIFKPSWAPVINSGLIFNYGLSNMCPRAHNNH